MSVNSTPEKSPSPFANLPAAFRLVFGASIADVPESTDRSPRNVFDTLTCAELPNCEKGAWRSILQNANQNPPALFCERLKASSGLPNVMKTRRRIDKA